MVGQEAEDQGSSQADGEHHQYVKVMQRQFLSSVFVLHALPRLTYQKRSDFLEGGEPPENRRVDIASSG